MSLDCCKSPDQKSCGMILAFWLAVALTSLQKCFNIMRPSFMQFPGTCREEQEKNVTYKALLSLLAH